MRLERRLRETDAKNAGDIFNARARLERKAKKETDAKNEGDSFSFLTFQEKQKTQT